jgi:hypothetical protein
MRNEYIKAISYAGTQNILARISALFVREVDTDIGRGLHYIVDLVDSTGGTCGARLVSIVCENHDIPVKDLRNVHISPIRDIVKSILETSPPRSAIILDTRDNELMQKVRKRIIGKTCDLRFRRVVFCIVDPREGTGITGSDCLHVPGNLQDRMAVLLYHIPDHIQNQAESIDSFSPLAEAMVDYALFEPRIWRHVCVDGTLAEFLSTALYQIVRRVRNDPDIENGAYPSFELEWRRSLAPRLEKSLSTPPTALCPSIHRVIPIGVSPSDAMQAMTVAIPNDIQNPYAITVQSSAMDDRCGSIVITQPMRYTVVNINCTIDPGILVDVCRELRTGHRAVVSEVHRMNTKLVAMNESHETQLSAVHGQLSTVHGELSIMRHEMTTLVAQLSRNDTHSGLVDGQSIRCSKKGCPNVVSTRFRSGKLQKQCASCLSHVGKTNSKRKVTE